MFLKDHVSELLFVCSCALSGLNWCACAGSTTPKCGRPSWRSSAASMTTWRRFSRRWASSTARITNLRTWKSWTWRTWKPWRTFLWSRPPPCSPSLPLWPPLNSAHLRPRAPPPQAARPRRLPPPAPQTSTRSLRLRQTGPRWFSRARLTRPSLTLTWTGAVRTSVPCPSRRLADRRFPDTSVSVCQATVWSPEKKYEIKRRGKTKWYKLRVQAINLFNHTSTDKVWISLFFVYFDWIVELIDMNSFVISADWITDWKTMTVTLALDWLTVFVTFYYFSKLPKLVWRPIRASSGTVALLRHALHISKRIQQRSTCSCLCFQRRASKLEMFFLPPVLEVCSHDPNMCNLVEKKFSNLPNVFLFFMLSNCQKWTRPQAIQDADVSSSEKIWRNLALLHLLTNGEMQHCISVSAISALQWMGAVRMRVQTADKKSQSAPLQSISSHLVKWKAACL